MTEPPGTAVFPAAVRERGSTAFPLSFIRTNLEN